MAFTQAIPRQSRQGVAVSPAREIGPADTALRVQGDVSAAHLADTSKTMTFGHELSDTGTDGWTRDAWATWQGGTTGRNGALVQPTYGPIDLVPLRGKFVRLFLEIPAGNPVNVGAKIEVL